MNQLNLNSDRKSSQTCSGGLICSPYSAVNPQYLSYFSTEQNKQILPQGQGQQHYSQLPQFQQNAQNQNAQNQNAQNAQNQNAQQQGGFGGSDWVHNFHAYSTSVSDLSNYTNAMIKNSPMFKPFSSSAKFATPSTGVVPTGQFYMQ